MEKNQIEIITEEIRQLIGTYTKESFVCFFADYIRNNPIRPETGFSVKLKSKLKDSLFLIALRLTTNDDGKTQLVASESDNDILEEVADKLNEIVSFYLTKNFPENYLSGAEQRNQILVHEATFRTYFQNGKLNYREQEINHILRMFHPYRDKIKSRLGIELDTLLDICDYSEVLYQKKAIKSQSFRNTIEFQKFAKMIANGVTEGQDYEDSFSKLPDAFFDFVEKPHASFMFSIGDYKNKFDDADIRIFCSIFSMNIYEKIDYTYYTQKNPLEDKPIIELAKGEFIHIYQKQLPIALYNLLYKTLGSSKREKEKLNERRGRVVFENHVSNIFIKFFKKDNRFKVFRNYYLNGSLNEKDLLIISEDYAFIVECKSSKFREPMRDLNKAFSRIKSDFNDCIQKGYDQCCEVEELCWESEKIEIVQSDGRQIEKIVTKNLKDVFSIVVTLERFGPIQTDLGMLLKRENVSKLYPWSPCADDLEIFLRTMAQQKNNQIKCFTEFLVERESCHEKLLASDELDVCAMYLQNPRLFKSTTLNNDFLVTDPKLQNFFDDLYYKKKLTFPLRSAHLF